MLADYNIQEESKVKGGHVDLRQDLARSLKSTTKYTREGCFKQPGNNPAPRTPRNGYDVPQRHSTWPASGKQEQQANTSNAWHNGSIQTGLSRRVLGVQACQGNYSGAEADSPRRLSNDGHMC